jgi:autotransporter-associated beta strand protein
MKSRILPCAIILTLSLGALNAVYADSATWNLNPTSNDWNTAANWTPNTVPNGPTDVATFARSSIKSLEFSAAMTEVAQIVFDPGGNSFKITADPRLAQTDVTLTISGAGITNNSGVTQNLVSGPTSGTLGIGTIQFLNAATAGDGTALTALGGIVMFHNNTTAANANITVTNSGMVGGGNGQVFFSDDSTAANATFSVEDGGVFFGDNSEAATAQFTVSGGQVNFDENASAADATFTIEGGGVVFFGLNALEGGIPTAGNGLFTINSGASVNFLHSSSGGNATLIANGGGIFFQSEADGGEAQIELLGEGTLDIVHHNVSISVGSIEGDGIVNLGTEHQLISGSNDLSTTFSGTIQDSGDHRRPGSLEKIGQGTLTLSGANTYVGATTVSEGALVVENTTGSGTGTGPVTVTAGTLGGSGIIAGAVTVGTGSGTGAFLAPAAGTNVQATLTIQSALTFNADATYTYTFKKNRNGTKADQVIANGVTINNGAMIALSDQTRAALRQGRVLTLISNTAAGPISGTFSNLPDGAIVAINGNNLQASYEGGDGNDLIFTVVP